MYTESYSEAGVEFLRKIIHLKEILEEVGLCSRISIMTKLIRDDIRPREVASYNRVT